MMKEATKDIPGALIDYDPGLVVKYCEKVGAKHIIRGLRAVTDFEYEFQMAITNKKLNPQLETIFLMANSESMYLSSSMVREVASMGGDISNFVPKCIHDRIVKRISK